MIKLINVEFIKKIYDVRKDDIRVAGGKGASLGELTLIDIFVPPCFIVLSNTFHKFLSENKLEKRILKQLRELDTIDIGSIEKASRNIRDIILKSNVPQDIENQIPPFWDSLNLRYAAVRSSAVSEDSVGASWVRQLDTFLNVNKKKLIENIKRFWAFLFNSRAIFYRLKKGLDKNDFHIAVIIQKMVNSEKSGIAFSANPVTGDHNSVVIEAGFGLGEPLVSGLINPDNYILDKMIKITEKVINGQKK